jgi:hypothetical protein
VSPTGGGVFGLSLNLGNPSGLCIISKSEVDYNGWGKV